MARLPWGVSVIEAVGGTWIVIVAGIQWAPAGQPRDRSGCGSAEYPTRAAAAAAFLADQKGTAR